MRLSKSCKLQFNASESFPERKVVRVPEPEPYSEKASGSGLSGCIEESKSLRQPRSKTFEPDKGLDMARCLFRRSLPTLKERRRMKKMMMRAAGEGKGVVDKKRRGKK